MCKPSRNEILRLYKDLLRYGRELKYTDREYYFGRIRREFEDNKEAKEENKQFLYEIYKYLNAGQSIYKLFNTNTCVHLLLRQKWAIDRSKVPLLDEKDLKEKYIKGGGPGGSGVNKSINCVCLTHEPTGITVKCHEDRSLVRNRKIARSRLVTKLDNLLNGEDSVENQKKRIEQEKKKEKERRRKKKLKLKEEYEKINKIEDQT